MRKEAIADPTRKAAEALAKRQGEKNVPGAAPYQRPSGQQGEAVVVPSAPKR